MHYKKARKLIQAVSLGGIAVLIVAMFFRNQPVQTVLFVIVLLDFVAAGVLGIKFWRCPECGAPLPRKSFDYNLDYCPSCGEKLK